MPGLTLFYPVDGHRTSILLDRPKWITPYPIHEDHRQRRARENVDASRRGISGEHTELGGSSFDQSKVDADCAPMFTYSKRPRLLAHSALLKEKRNRCPYLDFSFQLHGRIDGIGRTAVHVMR